MAKWIKQLTRENTLLDRSFRTIAYRESLQEIGKASISRSPIVGFGRVTSLYYDSVDYKKQQRIILGEFRGKRIASMSKAIVRFLEEGYAWAKHMRAKKFDRKLFLQYLQTFMRHHAHSRGAIVYGYWGEPVITAELRRRLAKKVASAELDATLSELSVPERVSGILTELHHSSPRLLKKRNALMKKLRLTARERELIATLSWFTFFYELGERVSSYMYSEFLRHLQRHVRSKKAFEDLLWYDPKNLQAYVSGEKLSSAELRRRKLRYILWIRNGKLVVMSGERARKIYQREFQEEMTARTHAVKGTVACQGRVVGTVRIIITQEDQRKMRKGDILLSPMTTPQLMGAIKKAAAIVTDEGGMTAHAAIVSRELGIPCIVGTKIATKIFQDGDRVEVDAERGVVQKL